MNSALDGVRNLINDIAQLKKADDYCAEYIMWRNIMGRICDSGEGMKRRMAMVERAEREFVVQHKKEILQLAAQTAQDELDAIVQCVTKKNN